MNAKFFEGHEYFVDEKANLFKFINEYKIYNENAEQIGMISQRLSMFHKALSLFVGKAMMPFMLEILDSENQVQAKINRGWTFWMSKIMVTDANDLVIATIQQKFKLLKPKFQIMDTNNNLIATITGDWRAWNFNIIDANENEIGTINKKWAGIAKEIFTSADKYNVSLKPNHYEDYKKKAAVISTAITIDMVLKESK